MGKKAIISVLALLWGVAGFGASDVASLGRLVGPGHTKTLSGVVIEGIVVSDWRSPNMELNPNEDYQTVNTGVNDATAYVQDADGACGIRIQFRDASQNRLCRYDHVKISLDGCTVTHAQNPDCITVTGLTHRSIRARSKGLPGDVKPKQKHICDLDDSDLYTFVTLQDMEYIFHGYALTEVVESYTQYTPEIHADFVSPSGRMDGWATLLRDSDGRTIYMLVNTLCPWRRSAAALPFGSGPVGGIIVSTSMRRYGGDMGRYSIRPLYDSDIAISRKGRSVWKNLTGWILDGSAGAALDFEIMGHRENLYREPVATGDRILNDCGCEAYLWTDANVRIQIESDLDSPTADKKGFAKNGAIMFRGRTVDWYDFDENGNAKGVKAFYIAFSAAKVKKAQEMALSFSWSEGDLNINHSTGFPLFWRVQCSVDGGQWITMKETATGATKVALRSLPYWDNKIEAMANDFSYKTGYDAGLGNQHRSFSLPEQAIGKDKVLIRICPAGSDISRIRKVPSTDVAQGKISSTESGQTFIRFGCITVDYR